MKMKPPSSLTERRDHDMAVGAGTVGPDTAERGGPVAAVPLMEMIEVGFRYPGAAEGTLAGVNLRMEEGEARALLGHNGSGKSTLLQLAHGQLRPGEGEIRWRGVRASAQAAVVRVWREVAGYLFQETDAQLLSATVEEDVAFGPGNLGWGRDRIREEVHRAMRMCRCEKFARCGVHELSAGERKRVALAGVVAMRPRVILADEPLAHLDPEGRDLFLDIFEALREEGVALLISTHHLGLAKAWFETATLLGEGRILAQGSAADIGADGDLLRRARLVSRRGDFF